MTGSEKMPASERSERVPVGSFDALETAVIDHLFALQPGYAVFLGLHQYDGRLPDYSSGFTDRWLSEADRLSARIHAFDSGEVPAGRSIDRRLLELLLASPVFDLREARDLERNPMAYLASLSMTSYMVREYAPAADRVRAMVETLREVPRLIETGRRRLEARLPAPFLRLSESIGAGLPSHFDEVEQFADRHGSPLQRAVSEVRPAAEASVREFLDRIRDEWGPKATEEFALGPARYQALLWVREGIRAPFSEMLEEGRRDLARNQSRLEEIVRSAGAAGSVSALLETLYEDHPSADDLVPSAQRFVSETREFVRDHGLATIPEPDSCRVEETPSYGRALSTASMNPPGPFDTKGDEGIYFVTPVDSTWPPERQEEWLRSLNRSMLRNITVHEVYPGHYLQFLHHRRAASSLARRVFMSNSFTEGWAHYCEQLAVEAGLGAGTVHAEVAQLHDALLRDCRLIASVGLHTGGMSLEQATELFRTEAHFERLPAEREAIRGTFNPEYFCYTLGKLSILRARARHLSPKFSGSLRAFHDHLLSFGAPPVGMIEELFAGSAA
jgi:uncharacterized protein (DUF885 family)